MSFETSTRSTSQADSRIFATASPEDECVPTNSIVDCLLKAAGSISRRSRSSLKRNTRTALLVWSNTNPSLSLSCAMRTENWSIKCHSLDLSKVTGERRHETRQEILWSGGKACQACSIRTKQGNDKMVRKRRPSTLYRHLTRHGRRRGPHASGSNTVHACRSKQSRP